MAICKKKGTPKARKKSGWGPEHYLQKSFFEWLALQHPDMAEVAFAVPNGVHCSVIQRKKLLAEGMLPGVLDVFVPWPTKKYPGLFIEFKWGSNDLSPKQRTFRNNVIKLGYKADVCWTIDEAMESLKLYLKD